VTYHFKDDIMWSDGEPFTVDDILYTREVIIDPDSGAVTRGILEQMTYEKIDDHTLKITYPPGVKDPTYFLPPLSTHNGISAPLPEHVLSEMTPAEIAESDYARLPNPVLGPYQFVEWVEGDRIVLEANENWSGGDVPFPNLIYRVITDTNQLLASTLSGECDFATSDGLQLTQLPFIQQSAERGLIQYDAIPSTVWEHIDFNTNPPAEAERDGLAYFGDVRVRQAVAYGTNRQQMTEQILYGEVQPLTSYLPSDHWAWNPETDGLYAYDPEQAKSLLEEAGWTDSDGDGVREASSALTGEYTCGRGTWTIPAGTVFEVDFHTTTGNAMREQLSTVFQANMADIGIKMNLDLVPAAVWFGDDGPLNQRTFQIGEFAWVSDPDPTAWFTYSGMNIIRTPEGTFVAAETLWAEREEELSASGMTYELMAFGRPTADQFPEGYSVAQNEQVPNPEDNLEGGNYGGFCDAAATQALFNGDNEIEPEARLPYFLEFQTIFAEQVPVLPLFQRVEVHAWTTGLCGPAMGPSNSSIVTWNIETWSFVGEGAECPAE
jgi:ABC-type transport system substrate-binding protein